MSKFLDDNGLLYLWGKIVAKFVQKETGKGLSTNDYTTTEKQKLAGIQEKANNYSLPLASSTTLGGVKIGSGLSIDNSGVLSSDFDGTATSVSWGGVTGKPTTISGYGISDAYTKSEVDAKVTSVYKPGGTYTFAHLPAPTSENLGMVYNVSDSFSSDSKFIDGSGKSYPAGTNVVVIYDHGQYWYDVLGGMVDLSGYLKISDVASISNSEIDSIVAS